MSGAVEIEPRREYPATPQVGVAAVIFKGDDVLLVKRGNPPLASRWSFPGGQLHLGETLAAGIEREVLEETGLRVRPVEIVTTVDCIIPDSAGHIHFHYVLIEWLCILHDASAPNEPRCGDDAREARWINRNDLSNVTVATTYNLDAQILEVLRRAIRLAETSQ